MVKKKTELIFAATALLTLLVIGYVVFISLDFLAMSLSKSLGVTASGSGPDTHFNLDLYDALKL